MKTKVNILEGNKEINPIISIMKGVIIAIMISMLGILLFAFILRYTNISDEYIVPINEVIKGVSIFLGVFIGYRKQKKQGLIGGMLIGLSYTIIAFVIFSLLDGGFIFNKTLLYDFIFSAIIGAICGIICVNLKKNSI